MKFITFTCSDGSRRGLPLAVVISHHADDRVAGKASDVHRAEIAAEFDADPQKAIDWAVSHMDFGLDILPNLKLMAKPEPVDVRSEWLAAIKSVQEV